MEDHHHSFSRSKDTPITKLTASSLFQSSPPISVGNIGFSPNGNDHILKDSSYSSVHGSTTTKIGREDYFEERSKLEKVNFDLKMKIYYLEEHIKKIQDNEQRHVMSDEALKNELMDLKLQIDEKDIELEQRSLYMIKAKTAIDALKLEVERLKNEAERQNDLEERVRKLKQINDDIELDYKQQLMILDNEVQNLKQRLALKDKERDILDERSKQIEVSFAQGQDRLNAVHNEKSRIEDKWLQAQQQIAALEEELTQCRAHLDLFKIRVDEEKGEKDILKEQVKDLNSTKLVADEKHRSKLLEVTSQFELQITTMRINHEQELEKLRAAHAQLLSDVRENYNTELNKAKSNMERSIFEVKQADAQDIQRVKDDCSSRITEKIEEIKSLRLILEGDRARYESIIQDLEQTRSELRERNVLLEHVKNDNKIKGEEIQALTNLRLELQEKERKILELQDSLKKESVDKVQLSLKNDQLSTQIDSMKQSMKEQEAELHISKVEMNRLTHVTSELGNKTDNMENVVRNNEKLTILHHKMQTEILEATHRYNNLERDYQLEKNEKERLSAEIQLLKQEYSTTSRSLEEKKSMLQEKSTLYSVEHEQRVVNENALSEQRKLVSALNEDLQNYKSEAAEQRQLFKDIILDYEEKCRCLLGVITMSCDAMTNWDEIFTKILQGGPPIIGGVNSSERDVGSSFSSNNLGVGGNGGSPLGNRYSRPYHMQQNTLFSGHSPIGSKFFTLPSARGPVTTHYRDGYPSFQANGGLGTRSGKSSLFGQAHLQPSDVRYDDEPSSIAPLMIYAQHHQMLSTLELEQGRHEVSLVIERINYKVDRTMKIRQIFDQSIEKLTKNIEKNLEISQEKVKVLQHRLNDSQQELLRVQQVVSRDQELHHKELTELKQLREVLIAEHRRSATEHESKYAQLVSQCEQEKALHEQCRQRVQRLQDENELKRSEISKLKDDLKAFEETEEIVAIIEQRMQSITSKNQSLEGELHRLQISFEQVSKEKDNITQEKGNAFNEIDRLSLQLDLKHEIVQDLESKIERYQKEVERLRSRQIDPELAMTLLSTQQQLSNQPSRLDVGYGKTFQQTNSIVSSKKSLVETIYSIEKALKTMIDRTEEGISRLEFISRNYTSANGNSQLQSRGKHLIEELMEDISHLLQENANLLSKVMQWISLTKSNHSASSVNHSMLSKGRREQGQDSTERQFYFPNRKGLTSDSLEAGGAIVLEDLMQDTLSPLKGSTPNNKRSSEDVITSKATRGSEVTSSGAKLSSLETSDLLDILGDKRGSKLKAPPQYSSINLTTSVTRASKLDRSLKQLAKKLDAFDLSTSDK